MRKMIGRRCAAGRAFPGHIATPMVVAVFATTTLGGCAFEPPFIPDEMPAPISQEAPTTETGSRIPRGALEEVRDSPQRVDVLSEEDLERQKPVSTRDAVRRATRGY